jgi:hypothetical protein
MPAGGSPTDRSFRRGDAGTRQVARALVRGLVRLRGRPPTDASGAAAGRRFDPSQAVRTTESRGETLDQVLDRNLAELLQELRVAFTGVQILFAFLLTLAFTQRFDQLDDFDVAVYTVTLSSTALATVLIAPVSFHRPVFRRRQKTALAVIADRFLLVGLALLAPAICGALC